MGLQHFLTYSLPRIIVSFLALSLGILAIKRSKSPTKKGFFLECISIFLWTFCYGIMNLFDDHDTILLFGKIGHLGVIFIVANLYYFAALLTESKRDYPYIKLYYAICIFFSISLMTTDSYVSGLYKYPWGYYPNGALLHTVALVLFQLVFFVRVLPVLFAGYFKAKRSNEFYKLNMIKYTFLAICVYRLADTLAVFGIWINKKCSNPTFFVKREKMKVLSYVRECNQFLAVVEDNIEVGKDVFSS